MRTRTLLVPTQLAIVVEPGGIRFAAPPPQWWLELMEPEVADAPQSAVEPPVVLDTRRTSCRPGQGPCRRRHDHTSPRRAA